MSINWRILFVTLLVFFIYHAIRDIFQILNIRGNIVADLFSTNHYWCRPVCDYVTVLPEVIGISGSVIVLKRNKIGLLGIATILSFIFISIGFLLP